MTITGGLVLQDGGDFCRSAKRRWIPVARCRRQRHRHQHGARGDEWRFAVRRHQLLVLPTTSPVTGQLPIRRSCSRQYSRQLNYTSDPDDVFLDVTFGTISPLLPPARRRTSSMWPAPWTLTSSPSEHAAAQLPEHFQLYPADEMELSQAIDRRSRQGSGTGAIQVVDDLCGPVRHGARRRRWWHSRRRRGPISRHADSFPPSWRSPSSSCSARPRGRSFERSVWTTSGSGFGGAATLNGDAAIGSSNVDASTGFPERHRLWSGARSEARLRALAGGRDELRAALAKSRRRPQRCAAGRLRHERYGRFFTSMAAFSDLHRSRSAPRRLRRSVTRNVQQPATRCAAKPGSGSRSCQQPA